MVSRDVVLQTVKRMYASGVDDATVQSTLRDIGLPDKEIESVIAEARGVKPAAPAAAKPAAPEPAAKGIPPLIPEEKAGEIQPLPREKVPLPEEKPAAPEAIAAKTAEAVKEHIAEAREEQALRDTTVHATIAEQAEKLEQMGKSLEEIKEKAVSAEGPAAKRIAALEKKLNKQDKELGEIKAATSALQSLLKKILETDRQVLAKLSGKKR